MVVQYRQVNTSNRCVRGVTLTETPRELRAVGSQPGKTGRMALQGRCERQRVVIDGSRGRYPGGAHSCACKVGATRQFGWYRRSCFQLLSHGNMGQEFLLFLCPPLPKVGVCEADGGIHCKGVLAYEVGGLFYHACLAKPCSKQILLNFLRTSFAKNYVANIVGEGLAPPENIDKPNGTSKPVPYEPNLIKISTIIMRSAFCILLLQHSPRIIGMSVADGDGKGIGGVVRFGDFF